MGKCYPSTAFLPSVALGTLLTRNWIVVLIKVYALGNSKEFNEYINFKYRAFDVVFPPILPKFLKFTQPYL